MREDPGGVDEMNPVSVDWSSGGELVIRVGGVDKVDLGTVD